MGAPSPFRSPVSVFWILFFAFSIPCLIVSAEERSLVVGESSKLRLSPHLEVTSSPGTKPGSVVLCERVYIHGLSRLKNLKKFSHSVKLNLSRSSSSSRNVEVCFHRNTSRGIGMCPAVMWEKVDKSGSWVHAMSPFDHKLLDIRIPGASPQDIELSIKEEYFSYRVIFLILGFFLLSVASALSKSLVFYYSSAMAIGIILVTLVILFQGMKLLPTGRKNSLAIFLYSSLVGLGGFLLRYVPGLVHSVLVEMGISEDMYFPLGIFLLAFVVLAGAWMGFWAVRKLVLAEDGSVDISTSNFVAWSIRIIAVIMILQSSLDPLLAIAALVCGLIVSSILRRIFRWRFLRRLYEKSSELVECINGESLFPDLSPFRGSRDEYVFRRPEDSRFLSPKPRWSNMTSNDSVQGLKRTPPQLSESHLHLSTFHSTPERRKFSKDEREKFTKDTTRKAIKELVSSPDFGRWAAENAERINVTPRPTRTSSQRHSKWRLWF